MRSAAVATLDDWAEQLGVSTFVETAASTLSVDQPNLRIELLGWLERQLSAALDGGCDVGDLESLLLPVVAVLEDRNADVRKQAHALLLLVVRRLGADRVSRRLDSVSVTSRRAVLEILEKLRSSGAIGTVTAARAPVSPKFCRRGSPSPVHVVIWDAAWTVEP